MKTAILLAISALVLSCSEPSLKYDPPISHSDPTQANQVYETHDGAVHTGSPADYAESNGTVRVESKTSAGGAAIAVEGDDIISGHCDVLNSGSLSPCASVVMVLDTAVGKFEQRTDLNGDFSFRVRANRRYQISIKSKQYKVTFDPKPPFLSGTRVKVQLEPI